MARRTQPLASTPDAAPITGIGAVGSLIDVGANIVTILVTTGIKK